MVTIIYSSRTIHYKGKNPNHHSTMKKKIPIIIATSLCIAIIIATIVWSCQTITRYHVILHHNFFEHMAYTDQNTEASMPLEIMLTDFRADTTTSDGTYIATTLLQLRGNNSPDGIIQLTFHPYQVHTFLNHRLYIEKYSYSSQTQQLSVIMTVEQRRYQTWIK